MIWKVPEMTSYLSDYFELAGGDVIPTGTPAGVDPVVRDDLMAMEIEGVGTMNVKVV